MSTPLALWSNITHTKRRTIQMSMVLLFHVQCSESSNAVFLKCGLSRMACVVL